MINRNEVLLRDGHDWLHFANPQCIVESYKLNEVVPALQKIESLVDEQGWHVAGFLSYESAPAFDKAHVTRPPTGFPLLWFGLYPAPRSVTLPAPDSTRPVQTWSPGMDRHTYDTAIDQIKGHISAGRTYQVNYTLRLNAEFDLDSWEFFLHLAQAQNNHAAYIDTGRYVIACASPELFFQLDGDRITCRPMKGTTHRGRTMKEDRDQAGWLKDSEKNRAENVMIVDMIRNDLGRIAKTGSIHVPELFAVEKYPTLWQMTSTVQARTKASLTKIFTALFPCASITGAPKVRTMQIISDLETTPRNIYTGCIGSFAPGRKARFNVAIRTALIDREIHKAEYGTGGGIVWDSNNGDEYDEALLKARVLTESAPKFSLLETMLWKPGAGFFLRERHLNRLLDSAEYFGYPVSNQRLEEFLDQISHQFELPTRIRLLLDKHGRLRYEATPKEQANDASPIIACLSREPVNSSNPYLHHKTTQRDIFDIARRDFSGIDDVLLFNERGELTEFTFGNLVVDMGGRLYTPPVSCGLLAGTFRAHLLELGQVEEKIIPVGDLEKCARLYFINSVRMRRKVQLLKK